MYYTIECRWQYLHNGGK